MISIEIGCANDVLVGWVLYTSVLRATWTERISDNVKRIFNTRYPNCFQGLLASLIGPEHHPG